ncbi:hypothetical protein ACMXYV_14480 [Neptuniibacter sp. SY11_33]|uniref:hypothetical protein n=1 Tax=Neptuniibacter sp. SY11_33 TaxID=3398215 RepID=UPI0039F63EBA
MSDIALEEPQTIIKIPSSKLKPQLIVGVLIVIAGLFIIPHMIGLGAILIISYFINSELEIIRFYQNYSEVKFGAIHSRFMILNSNIMSADLDAKKLILKINNEEKTITKKIPLQAFSEQDKDIIIAYYKSQVDKNTE